MEPRRLNAQPRVPTHNVSKSVPSMPKKSPVRLNRPIPKLRQETRTSVARKRIALASTHNVELRAGPLAYVPNISGNIPPCAKQI